MNNITVVSSPNNRGKIRGTLLEKSEISYKIEDENLSEANDTLPFTISEKLVKAYNLSLEAGDDVCFIGELRSYNKLIDGKSRLILSFFVKEVVENESAKSVNELTLTGYICKEPVYRTTPFNRQICDVLLAVNRIAFNKSDYIPCISWGRTARFCQNLEVGSQVKVIGRVQSRMYEKKYEDGTVQTRIAYEVSVGSLEIIEEKTTEKEEVAENQEAV